MVHARHGRAVLTDAAPFDEARRHDPSAVRAYRAALASRGRPGFGFALGAPEAVESFLVEDSLPLAVVRTADARYEVLTFAPDGRRGAVQVVRVVARRDLRVAPTFTGQPRLQRAAYTQLTEGGPLAPLQILPSRGGDEATGWFADPALGAAAYALSGPFDLAAGATGSFALAVALDASREGAIAEAKVLLAASAALLTSTLRERQSWWGSALPGPPAAPVRRAMAYTRDCAACAIGDGHVAMLADHELLPLVWTRDAYYMCRLLLALEPRGAGADLTASFLRWCFETAERPGGWWPRAALASGQAKDLAFQLDQQLYPLLLLEDHARWTGDASLLRRYAEVRDRVLRELLARRSPFGLVATVETPADDPLDRPFHFSSHVLLWRVLREIDPRAAAAVHDATDQHFGDGDVYAYAVRGAHGDGALRYHDANDLPAVFAPGWGFCPSDDARWLATMRFAWSVDNRAYVVGPSGGLGSVHTPHPWPLGDLQDMIVGRVTRDEARATRAGERLRSVTTWDGMLPEAYDERSREVASRHWFAWPIALWGLLERDPTLVAP